MKRNDFSLVCTLFSGLTFYFVYVMMKSNNYVAADEMRKLL